MGIVASLLICWPIILFYITVFFSILSLDIVFKGIAKKMQKSRKDAEILNAKRYKKDVIYEIK